MGSGPKGSEMLSQNRKTAKSGGTQGLLAVIALNRRLVRTQPSYPFPRRTLS